MVLFSTFSYLFHVKNESYRCNGNCIEKKGTSTTTLAVEIYRRQEEKGL